MARLDSNQGPTDHEPPAPASPTETDRDNISLTRCFRLPGRRRVSPRLGWSTCHLLTTADGDLVVRLGQCCGMTPEARIWLTT
jgi:hypothetical protein